MRETYTAAVTSQQKQMMFCILDQAVISKKNYKKENYIFSYN